MPQIVAGALASVAISSAARGLFGSRSSAAPVPTPVQVVETREDRTITEPLTTKQDGLSIAADPGGPQIGIMGRRRVGGRVIFSGRDASARDWLVIVIAGSPVATIHDVYLDNLRVLRGSDGYVTTPPYNQSCCHITLYDGTQTTAHAALTAAFPAWAATFVGLRCAYAVVRYTKSANAAAFGAGAPNVQFDVSGHKCFDPRASGQSVSSPSTWTHTSNAALIAAGYLVHELGAALPPELVDWTSVAAAADVCDEPVALRTGGTEPRYSAALVWTTDERHEDVLARVGAACGGGVYLAGSAYRVAVARFDATGAPEITPDSYVAGGLSFNDAVPLGATANGVRGTFSSPDHGFEKRDFPSWQDATALAQDGGFETWLDVALPAVTSQSQAQRLARLAYYIARRGVSAEVEGSFGLFDIVRDDVVRLTDASAGFAAQTFRVLSDNLRPDYTVHLALRAEDAGMHAWSAAGDEQPYVVAAGWGGSGSGSGTGATVVTTGSPAGDSLLVPGGAALIDTSGTPGGLIPGYGSYGPRVSLALAVATSASAGAAAYKGRLSYTEKKTFGTGAVLNTSYTVDAVAVAGVVDFGVALTRVGDVGSDPYTRYTVSSVSLFTSTGGVETEVAVYTPPAPGGDSELLDGAAEATTQYIVLPQPCAPYAVSGGGLAYSLRTNTVGGAQSTHIEMWAFDTLAEAGGVLIGTQPNSLATFAVSGASGTGKYYRCRTKNNSGSKFSTFSNPCLVVFQ